MAAAKGNDYTLKRKINPQHTQEQINVIINDLLEWAYNDDGIYLASYIYGKYKKAPSWLTDLAKHHPEVHEAIALAKQLIAGKVAYHCYLGDRNSVFGERILPMYCEEYKQLLKWKSALPAEAQAENTLSTLAQLKTMAIDGSLLKLLSQGNNAPKKG